MPTRSPPPPATPACAWCCSTAAGAWAPASAYRALRTGWRNFHEGVETRIDTPGAGLALGSNVLAASPGGRGGGWLRDILWATCARCRAVRAPRARHPHGAAQHRDTPGFFVSRTAQAREIVNATGREDVFIQYDLYHAQVMEGDLARTLAAHLPRIGHIQLADNPGRHEPGTGEINFPFLFAQLDALGYGGWVGCEYKPSTAATAASLGWMPARLAENAAHSSHWA